MFQWHGVCMCVTSKSTHTTIVMYMLQQYICTTKLNERKFNGSNFCSLHRLSINSKNFHT